MRPENTRTSKAMQIWPHPAWGKACEAYKTATERVRVAKLRHPPPALPQGFRQGSIQSGSGTTRGTKTSQLESTGTTGNKIVGASSSAGTASPDSSQASSPREGGANLDPYRHQGRQQEQRQEAERGYTGGGSEQPVEDSLVNQN
jgi:hypothetical protein